MQYERDCENCKHKIDGLCESWECSFEPKEVKNTEKGDKEE